MAIWRSTDAAGIPNGRLAAWARVGCVTLCLAGGGRAAAGDRAGEIEIHAFGDAGYVDGGGPGLPATEPSPPQPPKDWVDDGLRRMTALRSPDVNFLNLEGSLTRRCRRYLDKPFTFAVAPGTLAAFGRWGFNLVGLANNHALDCVEPTPAAEIDMAMAEVHRGAPDLASHGVASSAAMLASGVATLTVRGVTIGMIAIKAWENGRGAPVGNLNNRHELMRALQAASVDVRVLSLHGGLENTRLPTDLLMEVAREFVGRYGGDVVFAHHPHRAQGFELLAKSDGRAAVIFYSLGNFLHNGLSPLGDGMMARVGVTRDGVDPDSIAAIPLANASARPGPMAAADLAAMGSILRASNVAIALKHLPKGLRRLSFTLGPLTAPLPGFRLLPGTAEAAGKPGQKVAH